MAEEDAWTGFSDLYKERKYTDSGIGLGGTYKVSETVFSLLVLLSIQD